MHVLHDSGLVSLALGRIGLIHCAAHHVGIAIGLVTQCQLAQLTTWWAGAALIDVWTIASQAGRITVGADAIVQRTVTTSTFCCLQWIVLVDKTVASDKRLTGHCVQWSTFCNSSVYLNVCHAQIHII